MQQLEREARWNKWRGGFARCCKSAFVKAVLEPHLAKERKKHMIYSHTVRTRVTKGATKADMQSFVRGETWDDLMTRIKPSAPPLILYTKMTEQKMLDFVMSGLLMQMQFDKDLELRKLHAWDEEDEKLKLDVGKSFTLIVGNIDNVVAEYSGKNIDLTKNANKQKVSINIIKNE